MSGGWLKTGSVVEVMMEEGAKFKGGGD